MTASRQAVAAAAGVSVRTVSNVVNGFEHVAPATRARVLAAIERLDYRPSELARSLKRGRSGLIALVLPELDTEYFAELTRAFVEQGTRHGLTVVIDQTDGDPARELEVISTAHRGALFDALVVSPLGLQPQDLESLGAERPIILLGEDSHPSFHHVAIDNDAASREAVEHLIGLGRRRIAAIGAETAPRRTSAVRLEGYRAVLREHGRPVDDDLVAAVGGFNRGDGAAAMARLLDSPHPPDAVFCFSDILALGAMWLLHHRGIRIPEDIAVVGFDGTQSARYSTPSLTTIAPDKGWIAERSITLLINDLEHGDNHPTSHIAPHQLIVRGSTVADAEPGLDDAAATAHLLHT